MRQGLKVFACNGKRPSVKSWPTDFVSSSEFVLRAGGSYGIICEGFAVIDFDDMASRKDYPEGIFAHFCNMDGVSLSRLVKQSCIVQTPHGYHLYVAEDEALKQGQGFKDSDGRDMHVDVRSNGRGYIIGPGSVVASEGKYPGEVKGALLRYEALSDFDTAKFIPLQKIFPSLYKVLTEQKPGGVKVKPLRGDRVDKGSKPFDGTTSWCPASIWDGIQQLASAQEGERNQILFGVARYIKCDRKADDRTTEARLARVRELALDVGLTPNEVDATIESAGNVAGQRAAMRTMDGIERDDYIRNRVGDILPNEYNLYRGFELGDIDVSEFCVDFQDYLIYKPLRGVVKVDSDLHNLSEMELVKRIDWFFKCATKTRNNFLRPAVMWIKHQAKENPAQDFFKAIKEDGPVVSTKDLWSHMGIYAKEPEQSVRWLEACLLQSLRRMLFPGSPLDNIIILWGKQNAHKSSFVRALFEPYLDDPIENRYSEDVQFTETLVADLRDAKEVGLMLRSKFCLELAELAALKKTSEIAAIKDFVTKTSDYYRAPYAAKPETQKRSCTFIGTSNDEPELADQTGNRRYCLFQVVDDIDTVWVAKNRTAIWRNLYRIYMENPRSVVLTKEENAKKEEELSVNAFGTIDSADFILEYLSKQPTGRLLRSDIERYLCNDDTGPRLRSSRRLKSDIDSVMASLGNPRRRGRYSSYLYTNEGKAKVEAWLNFEDSDATADLRDIILTENERLRDENDELRRKVATSDTVSRADYDDIKQKYLEMAAELAELQNIVRRSA